MSYTSQQLRVEITTDVRGYGYGVPYLAGQDGLVADTLNRRRDGTNPPTVPTAGGGNASGAIFVRRADLDRREILEAIDVRDFIANANVLQASYFESVTQSDNIRLLKDDGSDTLLLGNIIRAVNNTNGSQTRLRAAAIRPGSRAEELWGRDTVISADDVSAARLA